MAAAYGESMIEVKSLSKRYKIFKRDPGFLSSMKSLFYREYETIEALKEISFAIGEGEFVGFIGPNGAGKTTTLKILSGILFPSEGQVLVDGFSPYEKDPRFLKKIAFMTAQKNNLWWDIPAKDSFLIHKVIYEIPHDEFHKRVFELSDMLGVTSLLDIPVRNLSLGERMKLEIMMSILHNPRLIFLDEPTIGLDFISRQQIREFLINYQRNYKATIILTSHYFEDIANLCKRLIIINNGQIVVDDSLNQIQREYQDYKVVRIRSHRLSEYKAQFRDNIVEENQEFLEVLLPSPQILQLIQNNLNDEFEIKLVSLEAMVKKHYVS